MLKNYYSNGTYSFSVINHDGDRVKLYSETGVPYLSMKKNTNCYIGLKDLIGFLEDEEAMKDYNKYRS